MPAAGRLREEDGKLEASQGCPRKTCLRRDRKKKKNKERKKRKKKN